MPIPYVPRDIVAELAKRQQMMAAFKAARAALFN